jgi:hypothetical protein
VGYLGLNFLQGHRDPLNFLGRRFRHKRSLRLRRRRDLWVVHERHTRQGLGFIRQDKGCFNHFQRRYIRLRNL